MILSERLGHEPDCAGGFGQLEKCDCVLGEIKPEICKLEAVVRAAKKLNIKMIGVEPELDVDYTAGWGAFRDLYDALADLEDGG